MDSLILNRICAKHRCWMCRFGIIYLNDSDNNWIKIGRITFRISTQYYHPEDLNGRKLGGEKDFELALLKLKNKPDV